MGLLANNLNHLQVQELNSKLYLTLDEFTFFKEMMSALETFWPNDFIQIFLIDSSSKTKKVADSKDHFSIKNMHTLTPSLSDHVVATKRPYFSNLLNRDPLYNPKNYSYSVSAELGVPIVNEGIVIGSVHLLSANMERKYSQHDIDELNSFLSTVKGPLTNMQMYLQAKALNESLQRRIEKNERELKQKKALEKAFNFEYTLIDDKELIGISSLHQKLMELIKKSAQKDYNIHVHGDAGSGKELIAHTIHRLSDRRHGAFVIFNCHAFNESNKDYENIAKFEVSCPISKAFIDANGGTLYLDDVATLDPFIQLKLLRYFQGQDKGPVEQSESIPLNVRVISSSIKDLQKEVQEGRFLHDLYFRLQSLVIRVPTLAQRKEDIYPILEYYLNIDSPKEVKRILSDDVREGLLNYEWPGNVRELINVAESIQILSSNERMVRLEHLPSQIKECEKADVAIKLDPNMTLANLEKQHICAILERLKGNKTKTAKILGITVKTLYNKLHSYGMISNLDA